MSLFDIDYSSSDLRRDAERIYDHARRDAEVAARRAYDAASDLDYRSWPVIATGAALLAGVVLGGAYVYWRSQQEATSPTHLPYEEWTKDQLYERARQEQIEGRSSMTKMQLIEALRSV